MARIRSIKPEFWVSEQVAECSTNARLLFVGLWNFCDDRGVHPAKPKTLKAELFPMDDATTGDVARWVDELIKVGLLTEFEATQDGEKYWFVTGWSRHQKIDRPSYKHPPPPAADSTSPRRTDVGESSSRARRAPPPGVEGNGKEGKGVGDSSRTLRHAPARTALPDEFGISDRVRAWAEKKGFDRLDAHLEAFRLKASAKGYVNADWDSALMSAIRGDWAGLRSGRGNGANAHTLKRSLLHADDVIGAQP